MELLVAVLYGWLLETLDMLIFGSYHYGRLTWWWVGNVPVYIPLLWATIAHSSMALSDRSGLPMWARPFLDGLLAVVMDLAVDAIAIRLGLWHWTIGLREGWFGVPAGNLCAWMLVAAWYGAVTRFVRARIARGEPAWHRWFVPVVAYVGLFASLMLVGRIGDAIGFATPTQRLWLFAAQLAIFIGAVVAGIPRRAQPDSERVLSSLVWNRWAIHLAFFTLLLFTGLYQHVPLLLAVSAGSLAIEYLAQRWCEAEPPERAVRLGAEPAV